MASYTALTYGLGSILLLFLGGLPLWRDPSSRAHRYFAAFALFMAGWLLSLFALYRIDDRTVLSFLGRFNFASVAAAVTFGHFFTLEFVALRARPNRIQVWETAVLVALTLLTPLVSASESRAADGTLATEFGPLFPAFAFHIAAYVLLAAYQLVKAIRHSSSVRGPQLSAILAGFLATSAFAIATNVVLPFGYGYFGLQEVGALSVVFLIGAFAYAIAFKGLFDVRIAIRRTAVFAALVGLALALYGMLVFLATQVMRRDALSAEEFLLNLLVVAVLGFTAEPLRRWVSRRTDAWLFQEDYERQAALADLNRKLGVLLDLDGSLDAVAETARRSLRVSHAIVYALEHGPDGGLVQKKVRHSNFPSSAKVLLSDRDGVLDYLARHPRTRRTEEIALHPPKGDAPGWNDGSKEAREKLESLGVHLAVPLLQGDSLIGLMLLGGKQSGSAFSGRDIEFAELVASSAVASIQKAKFYESDRTKTEFVSVAAHELLTPITAMRGYLSMVLVDGMGQVDERARGYLGKVAASADRLAALVRDLLSVSRLESGRIKVELKPTDVAPVIRSAIDQLAPIAAAKGLRLSFEPREPVPPAVADSDRLMEVLVNLIGNAVKYTPAGSVTVSAGADGGKVSVSVADTGLGIAPEARERLFEKFYRVRTAETEAIEGTGLGLYVTKSMVEAMGGEISVESAAGRGSTFLVRLPSARLTGSPTELHSLKPRG